MAVIVVADIDERLVLNEEALDELYAWIDTIPLSRAKKNIGRDFSDGVLVAETVAHFLPKMVDMHNYFAANSFGQKRINWNTLNRRVFSKMGIRISDSTIQQLTEAKAGAIEQVLWDLRRKIQEAQNNPTSPARSRARSPPANAYSRNTGGNIANSNHQSDHESQPDGRQQARKTAEPMPEIKVVTPNSPSRTGPILPASQQSHGYVVPPSNFLDEASNNQATSGPPAQIIYRGHKMIPLAQLDEKDREIKNLEFYNKSLTVKVHRLETLVNVKDQRIEDLTHQMHTLREMYERVSNETWHGLTVAQ